MSGFDCFLLIDAIAIVLAIIWAVLEARIDKNYDPHRDDDY